MRVMAAYAQVFGVVLLFVDPSNPRGPGRTVVVIASPPMGCAQALRPAP